MTENTELQVVKGAQGSLTLVPVMKDAIQFLRQVSQEMGLIIQRGDVMAYSDRDGNLKAYFTKSGLARMANARRISTKIEIVKVQHSNPAIALVKCTAILPDGTSHEEFGECCGDEPGKQNKPFNQILAMAITRARNRALNIACASSNCSIEEFSEEDEIRRKAIDVLEMEVLSLCPECREQGWSKSQKRCVKCGITYDIIVERKNKELEGQL